MLPTPDLPAWIRQHAMRGYVNAHALCPGETRLYGTESFYGDWSARVLLLAKDFSPSSYVRTRLAEGAQRPYSHDPARRTNTRLEELVHRFAPVSLLYGSALANLLRDDGHWSGALPNRSAALDYATRVLRGFVLPKLREMGDPWILCLGKEAWVSACAATGQSGDWRVYRDKPRPLGRLIAAFHPAARVSRERQEGPWRLLADLLG